MKTICRWLVNPSSSTKELILTYERWGLAVQRIDIVVARANSMNLGIRSQRFGAMRRSANPRVVPC